MGTYVLTPLAPIKIANTVEVAQIKIANAAEVIRKLAIFIGVTSAPWAHLKTANGDVNTYHTMKPKGVVADEMFPEGAGPYMDLEEAGGSSGLLMDLAANEKSVHSDFFNDFEDIFDDEDLA